jgi:hypothetical protein
MASPSSAVALIAEPPFGTGAPRCGRWPQAWPVTAGSNTSVLPNRDIVPAAGYKLGDILTVRVRRNGNVERTAKGPRFEIGKAPRVRYRHEGPAGRDKPCPGTRRTLVRGSASFTEYNICTVSCSSFQRRSDITASESSTSTRQHPGDQAVVSEDAGQRADPAPAIGNRKTAQRWCPATDLRYLLTGGESAPLFP